MKAFKLFLTFKVLIFILVKLCFVTKKNVFCTKLFPIGEGKKWFFTVYGKLARAVSNLRDICVILTASLLCTYNKSAETGPMQTAFKSPGSDSNARI